MTVLQIYWIWNPGTLESQFNTTCVYVNISKVLDLKCLYVWRFERFWLSISTNILYFSQQLIPVKCNHVSPEVERSDDAQKEQRGFVGYSRRLGGKTRLSWRHLGRDRPEIQRGICSYNSQKNDKYQTIYNYSYYREEVCLHNLITLNYFDCRLLRKNASRKRSMALTFVCTGALKKDWSPPGRWLVVWGGKNGGSTDGEWAWN